MVHFKRNADGSLTLTTEVQVTVPAGSSMLEAEEKLMVAVNTAGTGLTGQLLQSMDADGRPILRKGSRTLTAKAKKEVRHVETPYGCAIAERWAYQSSIGGACHYPMDEAASLVGAATPLFAKMVSRKMTELPAAEVVRDLHENHARTVSMDFVQRLTGLVGELAALHVPACDGASLPPPGAVATVSVGVDGACMLMGMKAPQAISADGRKDRVREWRVAMIGAITLYDPAGQRVGTIYAATAPPEDKSDGKRAFWEMMDGHLKTVKERYPKAVYIGLSDGAADLLPWLRDHTDRQVLDYFHASGYLHAAAGAFAHEVPKDEPATWWSQEACSHLRHDEGGAASLLETMEERLTDGRRMTTADREAVQKAATYFRNNLDRMDYAHYSAAGWPVGSGVTEAGCKLLVKKRMCGPGMTWGFKMADHVLKLRALAHSAGKRWAGLWKSILTPNVA